MTLGVVIAAAATRNPPAKNQPCFDSLHLTQRLQVILNEIDTLLLLLDPWSLLRTTSPKGFSASKCNVGN